MNAAIAQPYQHHRLTVANYHRMRQIGILSELDRVELIEGELVNISPIGSLHAGTVKYIANLLRLAVGNTSIISTQDPIFLNHYTEPQPDIALLKPRADYYRSAHPGPNDILLIIEVADTTLRYDMELKVPLYARHNIPEAWLVDLENRQIHIYREPNPAGYQSQQTFSNMPSIIPVMLPDSMVNLDTLFL